MTSSKPNFKQNYQTLLKPLKLKGLQPKTIEAYSRAIRRLGALVKDCGLKWAISMHRLSASISVIPRAITTVSFPCRTRRLGYCAASGRCTAILCGCSLIDTAA
jgi:hypothetical protein